LGRGKKNERRKETDTGRDRQMLNKVLESPADLKEIKSATSGWEFFGEKKGGKESQHEDKPRFTAKGVRRGPEGHSSLENMSNGRRGQG